MELGASKAGESGPIIAIYAYSESKKKSESYRIAVTVNRDVLRDLLGMAHKFVTRNAAPIPQRGSAGNSLR